MKPYYDDGQITIYHGDCLEILPLLDPVDLIITSPPYNKNRRIDGTWEGIVTESCKGSRFRDGYGTHTDDLPWPAYEQWQRETLQACWFSLNVSGAIFYNHKPRIINQELWTPLSLNPGLPLRQIVIWDSGAGINFMPGAYVPAHEWIMIFARPGFHLTSSKSSALSDVWHIPSMSSDDHPAPFPLALPTRIIQSTHAKTVLDPFMGLGTTLRAAKNLGRKAIGIELEERYCDLAVRRLQQSVMQLEVV